MGPLAACSFRLSTTIVLDHGHTAIYPIPMVESIAISEFKATCLRTLDKVNRTGESIVITRRGEPIALITPAPRPKPEAGWLGCASSEGKIVGDIVASVTEESDWEALS